MTLKWVKIKKHKDLRVYSSGGTEISTVSEKGFCDLDPKVEKNSNYDYFDNKYILTTNEV